MNNALLKIKRVVESYAGIPDCAPIRDSMYSEISKIISSSKIARLSLNFEVSNGAFTGKFFSKKNDIKKVSNLDLINV